MNDIKTINTTIAKTLEEFKLLPNDKKLESYGEMLVFLDMMDTIKTELTRVFSITGAKLETSNGTKILVIPEKPAQQTTEKTLEIDWDKYLKECPAPVMRKETILTDKTGNVLWKSANHTMKDVFIKVVETLDTRGAENSDYYLDNIHDLQKEVINIIETPKKNAMMRITKAK